MHAEFGLEYELRWRKRIGLSYYGYCEPIHDKLEILARVPNLRKISSSPWADLPSAARQVGGRYVLSIKPSPAWLVFDHWGPQAVRRELEGQLRAARGCNVELVLKEISTVLRQAGRL